VYPEKEAMGEAAAGFVAKTLRKSIAEQGFARVIFATGASQYAFLAALVEISDVDWSKVQAFHLDEYLGLPKTHPASFRKYLNERLFSHLSFGAIHMLDGMSEDRQAECARYGALLATAPIDVACIGIGENGHLAFNDPPADFEAPSLVHVVELDARSRQQQVGEGHFATLDDVPTRALTLSIPAIMQAKVISCVVPDERKAEAVQCALEGPITPDCPGSVMRRHPAVHMWCDEPAVSRLSDETMGG
jgi:glucosamine-6-phosphate deaminase